MPDEYYDPELESQFLSTILQGAENYIQQVTPDWFANEQCRLIFEAFQENPNIESINELLDIDENIDSFTLAEILTAAPSPKHAEYFFEKIQKNYRKRQLKKLAETIISNHSEPEQVIPYLKVELDKLEHTGQARGSTQENSRFLSDDLLRCPGFISEYVDYCLEFPAYPNPTMAFCGGLALQAFLAGRKACDEGDIRTNIYILGLAFTGAGKNAPRELNAKILNAVNMVGNLGNRFASNEGLLDALAVHQNMLFQTDEFDDILVALKNREFRYTQLVNVFLDLYTSSNSLFPRRPKASQEPQAPLVQPSLTIFGTAIPNHYYEASDNWLVTKGFFPRFLIVESSGREIGQEPKIMDVPERILETANYWAEFTPNQGNLGNEFPTPKVVPMTQKANKKLAEFREETDRKYAECQESSDSTGTSIWSRVFEQTRKLALIYALSENHLNPEIKDSAVDWASKIILNQTAQTITSLSRYSAENRWDKLGKKMVDFLEKNNGKASRSEALRKLHIRSKELDEVVETLAQRQEIAIFSRNSQKLGRSTEFYKLL